MEINEFQGMSKEDILLQIEVYAYKTELVERAAVDNDSKVLREQSDRMISHLSNAYFHYYNVGE